MHACSFFNFIRFYYISFHFSPILCLTFMQLDTARSTQTAAGAFGVECVAQGNPSSKFLQESVTHPLAQPILRPTV